MKVIGNCEAWGTGGPDYSSFLDYYGGVPFIKEDVVDTAGQPVVINIREELHHNAHTGTVLNKGPGKLYVWLSSDGEHYSDMIELGVNQFIDLSKEDVYLIKLDSDTSGNAYKIVAH